MARPLRPEAFCPPCIAEAELAGGLPVDPRDPYEVLLPLEVNCARHEDLNADQPVRIVPVPKPEWWGR